MSRQVLPLFDNLHPGILSLLNFSKIVFIACTPSPCPHPQSRNHRRHCIVLKIDLSLCQSPMLPGIAARPSLNPGAFILLLLHPHICTHEV
ncbi:hypothetical protein SLA2020_096920 [Shorea laevis]